MAQQQRPDGVARTAPEGWTDAPDDRAGDDVTTPEEPEGAAESSTPPERAGTPQEPETAAVPPPPPPADATSSATTGATATGSAPSDTAGPTAPGTPPADPPPPEQDGGSPFDTFDAAEPSTSRRSKGPIITLLVLLLLGAGYAATAWSLGDQVPSGTSVAGVSIGGLGEQQARERLEADLAELRSAPVPVRLGDAESTIDPAEVGLELDVEATVDELTGFTLDPRALLRHAFGGGAHDPVSTVDPDQLSSALAGVAGTLDVPPVEGQIEFAGTTPQPTEPEEGTAVDVEAAVELVAEDWLTAERPLELPSEPVEPTIGPDAVDEALTSLARPLVSAPVAVAVEGHLVELAPADLAAHAQFVAEGEELALELDGAALGDLIAEREPEIRAEGEDARFELQGGEPVIVPSTSGRGLAAEDVAAAVHAAGTSSTDRTAEVSLTETEPEFTTADAEALGIEEIVAEFSTPIPYDPVRTENLRVGSQYVTGTVVMPGENFSLLQTLGPITAARGFVSSGVVEEGFFTTALGGGLSQLSTNLYNVGFLAGMDDVEHKPHSRWFDRYPAGREATLWEPTVDMVWGNNTEYGVLIHSWVEGSRLYTRLWGTDVWDVETSTSNHYNITQPRTVYNTDADCEPEPGGQYGFTVNVVRERYQDGAFVDEQTWRWTYQPWNRVVCGSPEDQPEAESSEPDDAEPDAGTEEGAEDGAGDGPGDATDDG